MKMFNRTNRNAVSHSRFVVVRMSARVISMIFLGEVVGAVAVALFVAFELLDSGFILFSAIVYCYILILIFIRSFFL